MIYQRSEKLNLLPLMAIRRISAQMSDRSAR